MRGEIKIKISKMKRLIAVVTIISLIYITTFVNTQTIDDNYGNYIKINFLNSDSSETILDSVKNEVSYTNKGFNIVNSTLEEADVVIINIKDMNENIEIIKKMVEDNKAIYFYGNLSISDIAEAFNMHNTLESVKNNASESKKDINDVRTSEKDTAVEKNGDLNFIGIEKNPWGYSMVKGYSDRELIFNDLVKDIIDDSIHSKNKNYHKKKEGSPSNHTD